MLIYFAFDNDGMESSKRRVTFLSLIFVLKRKLTPIKKIDIVIYKSTKKT